MKKNVSAVSDADMKIYNTVMSVFVFDDDVSVFCDEKVCEDVVFCVSDEVFTDDVILNDDDNVSEIKGSLQSLLSLCLMFACC